MAEGDLFDVVSKELEDRQVVATAKLRYSQTDSYQAQLKSQYTRLHHYYAPLNGDQWPEDLAMRPGKLHITANLVKPLVDIDARLQAIVPRIALVPDQNDEDTLKAAEVAETLMIRWLELSGWDTWLPVLTQVRSLYGKGVLKPVWNAQDKRPDVVVVENPANLRIGWGSSDYTVKDWALYEYALSPVEVMIRWPDLVVTNPGGKKALQVLRTADHTDPLNQKLPPAASDGGVSKLLARPTPYQPSAYEDKQVNVWDYWYKKPDGSVWNAIIVGGTLAVDPTAHPEYPDIPYIVSENDHVPGNPEGQSTAEQIIDLQIEYNRALSHFAQLVADEVDPSYQLTGEAADSVPAGMIPKGGEIVAAGAGNEIKPIPKGVNQFPIQQLIQSLLDDYHLQTGFSEIVFGKIPSADVSGRALAVQVEAVINRLDPRRRRLYNALRELLIFWAYMVKKVNPKFPQADPQNPGQTKMVGVKVLLGDFNRWKIVAPEITPRDVLDTTTNVINQVNSKLVSLRTGMDLLGVDGPERELDLIRAERSDPHLFPGDVNAYVAVVAALNQVAQQQQQMQQQMQTLQQMQGGASGQLQAQQQGAQPQGFQGDNGASAPQPATSDGGFPPIPGQGPILGRTLVRTTPEGGSRVLNQLELQQKY